MTIRSAQDCRPPSPRWQPRAACLASLLGAACASELATTDSPTASPTASTVASGNTSPFPNPSAAPASTPGSSTSTDNGGPVGATKSGPSADVTTLPEPEGEVSSGTSESITDATGVSTSDSSNQSTVLPNLPPDTDTGQSEPPVNLPAGVDALFPAPGATGVCPDPTLHLWFPSKPSLGTRGTLAVYDAARSDAPVATVDLGQSIPTDNLAGTNFNVAQRVYVDANEVIVTLPPGELEYGKTYYVTIGAGVLTQPPGFAISDDQTWRFTTANSKPTDTANLRVALDDSAQFCTVQRAIEASSDDTTITVGPGNYYGVVYFKNKRGLTIRGDDREGTALKGINNNNLNPSTRSRALFGSESVTGLTIENLTIHNLTPQDGSQAEALTLLSCDQCVVRNANLLSLQDTLLWSGRIYAEDCYIAGNVDYIWGNGTAYFNRCEIHTVGRKGYNVQSRNGAENHGYVFVDSKLTSDPGVRGDVLARIDVTEYPHSEVAYINCEMGAHIAPPGWITSGGNAPQTLRFLEYQSRAPNGALIDVSQRLTGSRQLTPNEAATYRDPAAILSGWSPPVRASIND